MIQASVREVAGRADEYRLFWRTDDRVGFYCSSARLKLSLLGGPRLLFVNGHESEFKSRPTPIHPCFPQEGNPSLILKRFFVLYRRPIIPIIINAKEFGSGRPITA